MKLGAAVSTVDGRIHLNSALISSLSFFDTHIIVNQGKTFHMPEVNIINLPSYGLSVSRNFAIRELSEICDIICFVDDDLILACNLLRA